MRKKDYVPFGSTIPIVLAPYEITIVGGPPLIQVFDLPLYMQVRDILVGKQLASPQPSPLDPGDSNEGVEYPADEDSQLQRAPSSETYTAFVDQMLAALREKNLVAGSVVLAQLLRNICPGREEISHILGIYGRLIQKCVGASVGKSPRSGRPSKDTSSERENESEGEEHHD